MAALMLMGVHVSSVYYSFGLIVATSLDANLFRQFMQQWLGDFDLGFISVPFFIASPLSHFD